MQIFLPYNDFRKSLRVLDNKRLGKQRVETYQIISAITRRPKLDGTPYKGWLNHPCTIMWKDYVPALKLYLNYSIDEWIARGFKNTMNMESFEEDIVYPHWFGEDESEHGHAFREGEGRCTRGTKMHVEWDVKDLHLGFIEDSDPSSMCSVLLR